METVYLLEHLHISESKSECVKTIGVYASEIDARSAVERLKFAPGFKAYPELNPKDSGSGFYISCYEIGKDHWQDGFITVNDQKDD